MMMLHRAGPRALLTVPRTLALRVHTQPSTAPSFDAFKDRLNETMDKYPLASFASWIGINYSVFGFWFGTLYISNFSFGPLAVGFAIGGVIRRFRLPLDIFLASVVAKTFPVLGQIKIGNLMQIPSDQPKPLAMIKLEAVVNKYGAAYLVERAAAGLITCGSLTYAIHSGVDLAAWLPSFLQEALQSSAGKALGTTASCVAGAGVVNTMCLPFRIAALPYLAPILAKRIRISKL
eukprot:c17364_g1_i4.p1 GENE.c17364_g1_i4~~c17364_g1_i4.p1  ORF type:complete len:241 (+),score=31.35 c17364_g1_i4:22-723(+)